MRIKNRYGKNAFLIILGVLFAASVSLFGVRTILSAKAADEDSGNISQMSVSLNDNISANFYTVGESDKLTVSFNGATYNIAGDKATSETVDGTTYKIYTFNGIAPQYLGSDITATLYNGENETGSLTTSVKDNLDGVLAKTYAESGCTSLWQYGQMQNLCYTMLNYGAAAQQFVRYDIEQLVNAELTTEQKTVPDIVASEIANPTKTASSNISGLTWNGAGLRFDYNLSVYFVFTYTGNADLTAEIGENGATIEEYNEDGRYPNRYVIRSEGLRADSLLGDVTVTVSDGENTATATYGIKAYASKSDFSSNMAKLVKATYAYGKAAYAYSQFGSLTLPAFSYNEETEQATYTSVYGYVYTYAVSTTVNTANANAITSWKIDSVSVETELSESYIMVGGMAYSFADNNMPAYVIYNSENATITLNGSDSDGEYIEFKKPIQVKNADLILTDNIKFLNEEGMTLFGDPFGVAGYGCALSLAAGANVKIINEGNNNDKSGVVTTDLDMGSGSTLEIDGFAFGIYMNDSITIADGTTVEIRNSTEHAIGNAHLSDCTLTVNGTLTVGSGETNDVFFNNLSKEIMGSVVVNGTLNAPKITAANFSQTGGTTTVSSVDNAMNVSAVSLSGGELNLGSGSFAGAVSFMGNGAINADVVGAPKLTASGTLATVNASDDLTVGTATVNTLNARSLIVNDGTFTVNNDVKLSNNDVYNPWGVLMIGAEGEGTPTVVINGSLEIDGDNSDGNRLNVNKGSLTVNAGAKTALNTGYIGVGSGATMTVNMEGTDINAVQLKDNAIVVIGGTLNINKTNGNNWAAINAANSSHITVNGALNVSGFGGGNTVYGTNTVLTENGEITTDAPAADSYYGITELILGSKIGTDGYASRVLDKVNLNNSTGETPAKGCVTALTIDGANLTFGSSESPTTTRIKTLKVNSGTLTTYGLLQICDTNDGGWLAGTFEQTGGTVNLNGNSGYESNLAIQSQKITVSGGEFNVVGNVNVEWSGWGQMTFKNATGRIDGHLFVYGDNTDENRFVVGGTATLKVYNATYEAVAIETARMKIESGAKLHVQTNKADGFAISDISQGNATYNIDGTLTVENKVGDNTAFCIQNGGATAIAVGAGANVYVWNYVFDFGCWNGWLGVYNNNGGTIYSNCGNHNWQAYEGNGITGLDSRPDAIPDNPNPNA